MTTHELIAAFDAVAEAPDGVERLRDLVLQLAVRGKLVPQDPTDDPASVLLECIAAEKARLVRTGMIRKQELLPPVSENEVPWDLPSGWEWSRFGAITDTRLGKMLDKAKNKGPLRPTFGMPMCVLEDIKDLRIEEEQLADCTVSAGDL
jgi:type I restriction enzyme S subunit